MNPSDEIEVELQPFALSQETDAPHHRREILCKRPYREGGLRMEPETIDGKFVIHCYGHGGSGWTLAPGCGKRILDIIQNQLSADWQSAAGKDITIVGAGVVGLFVAYYLTQFKQTHPDAFGEIIIVAEHFEDITSHNAGGLFEPFTIGGDPDLALLADSYEFYHDIALGRAAEPEFQEFDIELLTMFSNTRDIMPSLVNLGYIPHGIPAKMRMGAHSHSLFAHQIFYMDVAVLMNHLLEIATRNGARAIRGFSLNNLAQIESPIVINCAGLGARELVGDDHMRPVLGHLIRLQKQPRAFLDVEHNLHTCPKQKDPLLESLSTFLDTESTESLMDLFARHQQSPADILTTRFPRDHDTACQSLLHLFFEVLTEARDNLNNNVPTPDPDRPAHSRIRLFQKQHQRNRFIDGLALIIRIAELMDETALHEKATRILGAYIPRFSKRYIFLLEQDFPDRDHPSQSYPGISYFMPILRETPEKMENGQFKLPSESGESAEVTAGIVGGTTIDEEDVDLHANRREFDRIIERMNHLGFR